MKHLNSIIKFLPLFTTALALFTAHSSLADEQPADHEKPIRVEANFPETDIFLFDLQIDAEKMTINNGRNVTKREGYDNQPYFTKDSKTFIFSRGDMYQTDVYEYHIGDAKTVQLSHSDNTEFSPTPSPDNQRIAFVSDRSNSIWVAHRDSMDEPIWALAANPVKEPIGYFSWNHKTGDILYWSQYGYNVTLIHQSKANYHYVTGDAVPSTPHIIPGTDNFSFVHRQGNGEVWIKAIDPTTKSVTPVTAIVGSNANYAWAPDGSIVMIENGKLYRWRSGESAKWLEVANLSDHGIENANRVAVSLDSKYIAIVGVSAKQK